MNDFASVPESLINRVQVSGPPIVAQLLGESALTVSTEVGVDMSDVLVLG